KDGSVTEFTEKGVDVGEEVKSAELTRTVITGQNKGYGVYAVGGEMLEMTLDDVRISKVQTGVEVKRGKSLTMIGGTITGLGKGTGVDVTGSGEVTLEGGVKIRGFTTGVNVGGNLTMTGGSITGNGSGGYGVYAVGTVRLDGEVKISEVGMGVSAGDNLTMTGGSITGGRKGVGVYAVGTEKMTMVLDGVRISEVGMGVYVKNGKSLTIRGNSTISLADGGEYGVGVYVGEGVKRASLTKTVIKGGRKGVGVYAVGTENMTMTLEGVEISEVGAGVYVKNGTLIMRGENSTISLADGGRYGGGCIWGMGWRVRV
ncbi:hypothetical protein GGR10_001418, partial [Bartonella chomelii]